MPPIEYRARNDQEWDQDAERLLPAPEANPGFDDYDQAFKNEVDHRFQAGIAKGLRETVVAQEGADHAWEWLRNRDRARARLQTKARSAKVRP